jgi:hypothetical protein
MRARFFAGSIGAAGNGFAEFASVSSRQAAVCVSRRVAWLNRRKNAEADCRPTLLDSLHTRHVV